MEVRKTVGSDATNDIVLAEKGISPFHALLILRPGGIVEIEDVASKKGTSINNRRILSRHRLNENDLVSLGDNLFDFRPHYPDFLLNQKMDDTQSESEDVIYGKFEEIEELPEGTGKVKKWLQRLQYPADRQKTQRMWFLIISGIMLLTMISPYLSWGNKPVYNALDTADDEPFSGIMYFLGILEFQAQGGSLLGILSVGIMIFTVIGTAICSVLFFLYGLRLWKPKSIITLRQVSLVLIWLFGFVIVKEFFRFVSFWGSSDGARTYYKLSGGNKPDVYLLMENLGIGFWICFIGAILLYRSTENKLWRPELKNKWATLTFSFWLPFVILLGMVHQDVGISVTTVDVSALRKRRAGPTGTTDQDEEKLRICQTAPMLAMSSYLVIIQDQRDSESSKLKGISQEIIHKRQEQVSRFKWLWLVLHFYLGLTLFAFFYRRFSGYVRLGIGGGLFVVGVALYFIINGVISDNDAAGNSIYEASIGYAVYLTILCGLGVIAEQLYFFSEKERAGMLSDKTIDNLEEDEDLLE